MGDPAKCPWCGSRPDIGHDYYWVLGEGSTKHFYVMCNRKGCFATGPNRKTERGAVNAWNRIMSLKLGME